MSTKRKKYAKKELLTFANEWTKNIKRRLEWKKQKHIKLKILLQKKGKISLNTKQRNCESKETVKKSSIILIVRIFHSCKKKENK